MSLERGTRLGPYEITATLGAGGMGQVYRARDTRLKRDVALKVLPESFATDPERLARFQREAEVLATLNHPHIATIFGFEESPPVASGQPVLRALVLELVEGETLADRLARGPIPPHETLPIARQIAEALEAAHERGIVHRDLKPSNIALTNDGQVKVLDFGLAKLTQASGLGPHAPSLTASPTITSPALTTGVGALLGTAGYMSPEQAKGREADKRGDVWAFGCVLYEMLTGRRAFDGEDVGDTLAAVLRGEPDWAALPSKTPAAIRALLRSCLQRDRRKRLSDIAGALFVLDRAGDLVEPVMLPSVAPAATLTRRLWRRAAPIAVAAAASLVVGGAIVRWWTRPSPPSVVRTTITSPDSAG
jgi:serine/threonine protein kinase